MAAHVKFVAAGHGHLARKALFLDVEERRKRDGVLPLADEPRR